MAAGQDWVEVSLPEHAELGDHLQVRFLPSRLAHDVQPGWRGVDRVGLTYVKGGPPEDQFAGLPGLLDPRPAFRMLRTRSAPYSGRVISTQCCGPLRLP